MKYYSRETGSFYADEIHGNNKPSDCVEITDEKWAELVDGRSNGGSIEVDDQGIPFLVPAPELTVEQINEVVYARRRNAYKKEADGLFFQAQRGDIPLSQWEAKVDEIKTRFPKGVLPE